MGFFDKNTTYADPAGEFEVAEPGTYVCDLDEIVVENRPSFDDRTKNEPTLKFAFVTTEAADSQGFAFKFIKFTGTKYGNENANLTQLLNGMLGLKQPMSQEEYGALELADLKGRQYNVTVLEHTTEAGKLVNKIAQVRPVRAVQQAAAPAAAAQRQPTRPAPAAAVAEPEDQGVADEIASLQDPFGPDETVGDVSAKGIETQRTIAAQRNARQTAGAGAAPRSR